MFVRVVFKDSLVRNKLSWGFCRAAFLELITALPVTTEVGGTSQVNVMMVPLGLGNKLESEIDGPGKRGIVSEGEIKRGQERRG